MNAKRILSVGQCAADTYTIGDFVRSNLRTVAVDPVHSADEALNALASGGYDLILVNRVFDLDGASGLDFIRQLKADPALSAIPVMLISNHADAQGDARAAGAIPGFGKANLGAKALAAIRTGLGH